MRCIHCKKVVKENTEGNLNYCQGHSPFAIGRYIAGSKLSDKEKLKAVEASLSAILGILETHAKTDDSRILDDFAAIGKITTAAIRGIKKP